MDSKVMCSRDTHGRETPRAELSQAEALSSLVHGDLLTICAGIINVVDATSRSLRF
jgi:hypothetical protein